MYTILVPHSQDRLLLLSQDRLLLLHMFSHISGFPRGGPEGQGITVTTVGCLLVRGLGGSEGRALENKLSYFRLRNELENNWVINLRVRTSTTNDDNGFCLWLTFSLL